MKKVLFALLVAAMLLSSALADSRVAQLDGRLYLSLSGLLAADESGVELLDDCEIKYLQSDGENLYYVAVYDVDDDAHNEALIRMDASGNTQSISADRFYGAEYAYTDTYSQLTDYTFYPGFGDMTICGDYIYFIGANGAPGSYFTVANDWGDLSGEYETRYASSSSVYRMNKDGSNLVELIPDLGNAQAHMDVNNGVIAVASCWRNSVYAYDFSDFRLYDLDGKLIREIENTGDNRHSWIYKDDCEFTCIVTHIQTDGQRIYASLSDSEGDFASSRLTDMDDPGHTLALEAFFTPSIIADDGVAMLTSDAEDNFWDEIMETSLKLYWENGVDSHVIAPVPYDFARYEMHLDRVDDMLYLSNGEEMLRVSISGGEIEQLGHFGFETADFAETASEDSYFLPDSDVRLYTEEELSAYDKETLGYMRNEILARHGYVFKKEHYKNHFGSQSWYTPNPDFYYGLLSDVEMQNVETIKALEAK